MRQAEVGLNLPNALVLPSFPMTTFFLQHLPVNQQSSSVYIYQEGKEPVAFLQVRARNKRQEWEIMALGTIGEAFFPVELPRNEETETNIRAGAENADPEISAAEETLPGEEEAKSAEQAAQYDLEMVWMRLLEHIILEAGDKGIERIYAKLSKESPEIPMFGQMGFHAYTHESLFEMDYTKPVQSPEALVLRPQRNRDLWQIQRLYEAVTPSPVQHAEQLKSDSWEINKAYFPHSTKYHGWVLSGLQDDRASAYIRIINYRSKNLIQILNANHHRYSIDDLIRFALSQIKPGPDCQVYCSVREYQSEQEAAFEELGFKYFGKQSVLVKHIAHMVRANEKATAQIKERRLELPQTTVSTPITHLHHFRRFHRPKTPKLPPGRVT